MNSVRDCLFPPSIPYFLCPQSELLVRVLRETGGPRLPAGSDPSTYQRRGYRGSSVSDIEPRKHSLGDASENPVTDMTLLAPLCSVTPSLLRNRVKHSRRHSNSRGTRAPRMGGSLTLRFSGTVLQPLLEAFPLGEWGRRTPAEPRAAGTGSGNTRLGAGRRRPALSVSPRRAM